MKLIPTFENFENSYPLEGKITPELSEKLAQYFSDGRINEADFIDSIKNTLSKTFLGSLSYINMIDKLRTEIIKIEKELISKKYAHEDEIDSLKKNVREVTKTGNTSAVEQTKKTIANKMNEYLLFKKLSNSKVQQALDIIDDIIKGNKRRSEYWNAGRAKDEVETLKFEYDLAKKRTEVDPDEIKSLEEEIRKANAEAEKAERERKEAEDKRKKEEDQKKKEEDQTEEGKDKIKGVETLDAPDLDWNKEMRSAEGRRKAIKALEEKIASLKYKADKEKGYNKEVIQAEINWRKELLERIEKRHNELKGQKVLSRDTYSSINKDGRDLDAALAPDNETISTVTGSGKKKKG